MFPDHSFDVTPFTSVTWSSFRNYVLLPEATTLLVQQDISGIDRDRAIDIVKESREYGTLLHPDAEGPHIDDLLQRVAEVRHGTAESSGIEVKREEEEVEIVHSDIHYREVNEGGQTVLILDD